MKRLQAIVLSAMLVMGAATSAQGNEWEPVTGAQALRDFMSGVKAERELPNGDISRGEYNADGTGTLYSWGAAIPRTWEVKGDDQICVTAERVTGCFQLERNTAEPDLYRVIIEETGEVVEFRVTEEHAVAVGEPPDPGNRGGAAVASASEMAAQLSNPNTSVATLNFKNQFRGFEGDLPDADNQFSYTQLFQPVLPFVMEGGDKFIWRPAIPILVDQPVFNFGTGGFEGKSGLGDIAFDLVYAPKTGGGLMLAFGIFTTLPTATNDLGKDKWSLGPEFLLGKVAPKYVYGMLPNHQWDIAGSGNAQVNLTTTQLFYTYLPGGGWSVGSGPSISYDWVSEQWTVPLQINTGKTVILGGRPWKFSVELNYYVEKADAFGPEWMLGLNIAPVVKNGMAKWFGLGKD